MISVDQQPVGEFEVGGNFEVNANDNDDEDNHSNHSLNTEKKGTKRSVKSVKKKKKKKKKSSAEDKMGSTNSGEMGGLNETAKSAL